MSAVVVCEGVSFRFQCTFKYANFSTAFVPSGWLLSEKVISVLSTALAGTQLHTLK